MLKWWMPTAIVKVTLARTSGLPEDVIVNTMHFESDVAGTSDAVSPGDDKLPGLVSRLDTFYKAIGGFLGGTLTGAARVDVYDIRAPKPRVPVFTAPITFTPSGGSLPGEVALCLSFRGARISGQTGARTRGRIFLGPLASNPTIVAGQGDVRPTAASLDTMLQAGRTMARGAAGTYRLVIFSPTTFATTNSVPDSTVDAEQMWIDNAFDTIRSRGARGNLRRQVNLGDAAVPVSVAA